MSWSWHYLDADGAHAPTETTAAGETLPDQPEAVTRSDAESWLGENWRALFAAGVVSVTLREDDRTVYTMSLSEA